VYFTDGEVCLLQGTWGGAWGSDDDNVRSVACVLVGLQMLLGTREYGRPANIECARQAWYRPKEFQMQAKSWTWQYAM
jgi:ubiquitin-protein ligase